MLSLFLVETEIPWTLLEDTLSSTERLNFFHGLFEKKSWYPASVIGSAMSWESQGLSVSIKLDLKRPVKSHREG